MESHQRLLLSLCLCVLALLFIGAARVPDGERMNVPTNTPPPQPPTASVTPTAAPTVVLPTVTPLPSTPYPPPYPVDK